MTTDAPLPLAYAVGDDAVELERRLRRMISGVAIALGGLTLLDDAWSFLATAGVIPSQIIFEWSLMLTTSTAFGSGCSVAMVAGGIIFWRGRYAGLWMIRAGAAVLTLYYLYDVGLNVAVHLGLFPGQPAYVWQDTIYDAISRMTWVFGAPAVLLLLSLTPRRRVGG